MGDAFDGETGASAAAGVGQRVGQADSDGGGLSSEAADDLAIEGGNGRFGRVLLRGQLIAGDQDVVRAEAGIDGEHLLIAAQEGERYREQDGRDSNFSDDKR